MTFANFEYLFLLVLLVPYIVWYMLNRERSTPSLRMSSLESFTRAPKSFRQYFLHVPFLCRLVCLAMAIIALARPQTTNNWSNKSVEGIDIMLCMDVSTSMLAEDLKPNRIEAAKKVAIEFISGRPDDNIGLIDDGTAIGMGIANAVTRLKDSKAKSKVIILLTDGTNNRGQISPSMAADIAQSFGIRVYTIGVGTNGTAPYPVPVGGRIEYMNVPVEIDTKTLATIAAKTEGEFYRAENTDKLREVYQQIDKLEKTKMNVKKFSKRYESYGIFALISVLALMLELLLRKTWLKRFP